MFDFWLVKGNHVAFWLVNGTLCIFSWSFITNEFKIFNVNEVSSMIQFTDWIFVFYLLAFQFHNIDRPIKPATISLINLSQSLEKLFLSGSKSSKMSEGVWFEITTTHLYLVTNWMVSFSSRSRQEAARKRSNLDPYKAKETMKMFRNVL